MSELPSGDGRAVDPRPLLPGDDLSSLVFDDRGLLPVVVQDAVTGAVLMLAYANREAVSLTLTTGEACFWSRSRRQLWKKGETSGNVLRVEEVLADCDRDALLVRAHPAGPACHRGTTSCFEPNPARLELGWLARVLEERRGADPEGSYTARLLARGLPRIAQKVGEEAVETVIAALTGPEEKASGEIAEAPKQEGATSSGSSGDPLVAEASDLLYHLLVLLTAKGVSPAALARELARRHRPLTPNPAEEGGAS